MNLFLILIFIHVPFVFTKKNFFVVFSFLLLVSLLGLRTVDIGTDTANYLIHFETVLNDGNLLVEPLWLFTNKLAIMIGGGFNLLLLLSDILFLLPIYYIFNKDFKYPILGIIIFISLYFYALGFNIMRQAIAMSWMVLSYYLYSIGNKKRSLVCYIISVGFHITSIVNLFFAILIFSKNISEKILWIVVLISLPLSLIVTPVILSYVPQIMSHYTGKEMNLNLMGNLLYIIVHISYVVILRLLSSYKGLWYKMTLMYLILMCYFIRVPFGDRFILYLGLGLVFYILKCVETVNLKINQKVFIYFLVISLLIISFYLKAKMNYSEVNPYESIIVF